MSDFMLNFFFNRNKNDDYDEKTCATVSWEASIAPPVNYYIKADDNPSTLLLVARTIVKTDYKYLNFNNEICVKRLNSGLYTDVNDSIKPGDNIYICRKN